MSNIFTKHPKSVGEGYWEHMFFAMRCASKLIIAGLAGMVHAIFPFLFIDTASKLVAKLTVQFHSGERKDDFCCKVKDHLPENEHINIKKDESI